VPIRCGSDLRRCKAAALAADQVDPLNRLML
jgi:hypothetical protein